MKRILCLVMAALLAVAMTGCGGAQDLPLQPDQDMMQPETESDGGEDGGDAVAVPPPSPQETAADAQAAQTGMQISVRSGGNTTIFALNDSGASAALYAQLPLTLTVEDYGSNEKIFYPPDSLDTADTPVAGGASRAGVLAYYAPWGDVVMFHDAFGPASGLYELGDAVSGAEHIAAMSGEIEIARHGDGDPDDTGGRTLLVYLSHTGTTGAVAEQIVRRADVDVFEIIPAEPYPADYSDHLAVARSELEADARPAIAWGTLSLDGYDTVLLGYPIWHGTIPMPVATFLEGLDFSGVRIAPFCTSGSTSISRSEAHIAELAPGAQVLTGLGITSGTLGNADTLVETWLSGIGLLS